MRPAAILITALVLSAGALTACGGANQSASPSAPAGTGITDSPSTTVAPVGDIVISNFAYTVAAPLRPGQQVAIINKDDSNHTVTADANNAFDVRISGGGGLGTFTAPTTPGTYPFHCKYHANMHGSLTVQ
jgi:plastocyanin